MKRIAKHFVTVVFASLLALSFCVCVGAVDVYMYCTVQLGNNYGTSSHLGRITVSSANPTYVYFTPNPGYRVQRVMFGPTSDPAYHTNIGAISTVSVNYDYYGPRNCHMTVYFEPIPITYYTVTATAGSGGSISPSGASSVQQGTSKTYSITPSSGYRILDVKVNGSSVGAVSSYTFSNVQSNQTIVATFEPTSYTVTATAGSGGSISPSGASSVQQGGSQTYSITPSGGYRILDVKVNGSSVGAVSSYTFSNVQSNQSIAATFEPIPTVYYTVTASAGSGGSIAPSGSQSVAQGGSQSYSITPSAGFRITDVRVNGSSVGAVSSYQFTNLQGNQQIAASFEAIPTYTVTAAASAGGTVTPLGAQTVTEGGSASFAVLPDSGYRIADVLVNHTSVGPVATYSFSNVQSDQTLTAVFEAIPTYTVMSSAGAGGTVSPAGSQSVTEGGSTSFSITPSGGYRIFDVTVDGASVGKVSSYAFSNIHANHTLAAAFELIPVYDITASGGTGGTVAPVGLSQVTEGGSITYTMNPDTGFQVADVLVNGVSVGAVTTYTFSNVQADGVLAAKFKPLSEHRIAAEQYYYYSSDYSGGHSGTLWLGSGFAYSVAPGSGDSRLDADLYPIFSGGVPTEGAYTFYARVLLNDEIGADESNMVLRISGLQLSEYQYAIEKMGGGATEFNEYMVTAVISDISKLGGAERPIVISLGEEMLHGTVMESRTIQLSSAVLTEITPFGSIGDWGVYSPLITWMRQYFDERLGSGDDAVPVGDAADALDGATEEGEGLMDEEQQAMDGFMGQFEEYETDVSPNRVIFSSDILNSMSFIGGTFMQTFDGLGQLQVVMVLPMVVGIVLLLIGRGPMAWNMHNMREAKKAANAGTMKAAQSVRGGG